MLLTSPWNHCIHKSPWLPCANWMAIIKSPNWDVHPHISTSMEHTMLSLSFSLLYSLSVFPLQASHEAHSEKLNYSHTFLRPSSADGTSLAFIHLFSHSVLSLWGASRFPLGPHAPPKVSAGEGNKVSEDTSLVTVRMGPSDRGRIYRPSGPWERRRLGLR